MADLVFSMVYVEMGEFQDSEQNRKFAATVENLTYPHFQSVDSY